jgi:sirohydrochlorin ferrochelatase
MSKISVLIVGHGGKESRGSEQATARVVEAIRKNGGFGSVHALYLEQEPLIETWRDTAAHSNIVVVPFLIGGGGHEAEIRMRMKGDKIRVTTAVGEHDELARMITDQVGAARPI